MSKSDKSLTYSVFETCLGWMAVIGSPVGIKAVILPHNSKKAVLGQVAIIGGKPENQDSHSYAGLADKLQRYFSGEAKDFPDKLDLDGTTDFQQSVWRVVRQIPRGKTRSYGWVAAKAGSPKAARAVGRAMATNPVPIIIPCYRVISGNGKLGGFGGGLKLKKFLLDLEERA